MNFFGKKSATKENQEWGCLSRRENDYVVIAYEFNNSFFLSKLPRQASLEMLRLQGKIRTVVPGYYARTARLNDLNYEGEIDNLKIGTEYLGYLKKQKISLKEKRVAYTTDQTGTITGITAREKDVSEAAVSVEGFRARIDSTCPVEVETRGRAIVRLFISRNVTTDAADLTVCAAVVEEHGYSFAFWNQEKHICWEVEQPFTEEDQEDNWSAVADELRRLVTPASLESLNLHEINQMVLVASEDCRTFLTEELAEDKITFEEINFNEGEDFILSDGSQSLKGNETAALIAAGLFINDSRVPKINLNLDLEEDIHQKSLERVRTAQLQTAAATRNLNLLLTAPVAMVFFCGIIYYATLYLQEYYVTNRRIKAQAEETRLDAVTKEIETIKTSADKVQLISARIGALRTRQPANFLLLMTLNRKWPRNAGGAWQVDEITSKPDGTVAIKGKTTSDASLTEFAKNLDFSEDFDAVKVSKSESGASSSIAAAGFNAGAVGTLTTAPALNTGVIKFAVEARYLPLAPKAATPASGDVPGSGVPNAPSGGIPQSPQIAGVNKSK